MFGAETASKMLEKWDTAFKPKIIDEAKHLTRTNELFQLLKTAENFAENDETSKYFTVCKCYSLESLLFVFKG